MRGNTTSLPALWLKAWIEVSHIQQADTFSSIVPIYTSKQNWIERIVTIYWLLGGWYEINNLNWLPISQIHIAIVF